MFNGGQLRSSYLLSGGQVFDKQTREIQIGQTHCSSTSDSDRPLTREIQIAHYGCGWPPLSKINKMSIGPKVDKFGLNFGCVCHENHIIILQFKCIVSIMQMKVKLTTLNGQGSIMRMKVQLTILNG